MIKKDTGRAVHLRDDDTFSTVDNKRTVTSHQGHVAHIYFLLLDVSDAAHAREFVNIPNNQAQSHLQRRSICDSPLLTFLHIIFWFVEFVMHELKRGGVRKVLYRKYGLKDFLQPVIATCASIGIALKKILVRILLHFDQVWHFCDLGDPPKIFAQSPMTHI